LIVFVSCKNCKNCTIVLFVYFRAGQ